MDPKEPYPTMNDDLDGVFKQLARSAWQAVLIAGVIALAVGIIVLAWPEPTLRVVGVLFGLYLLIAGVFQLIAAFGTHASTAMRVMAFISGTLSILLGLFCFRGTTESIFLLAIWIGIGWLFRGITGVMAAMSDRAMPGRGWQMFLSIVELIAGVVLLVAPLGSIRVLTVLAGCWLIAVGLVEIVSALRMRKHVNELEDTEWSASGSATRTGEHH
ncbi:HdeD family acid-resistance protein [Yinghuangia seranimata]|uniref:HdeD family acid-resistance protein n=1 Tax=Yinghuangia seranimata TaxID=408067 RepID=UPI00248C63E3|nr:HdeD family acid-resistance protein [Yinghuangia seranimata]MDI2125582.1 HdeD family acid-resistance protein [Yinghuangia seranimata]